MGFLTVGKPLGWNDSLEHVKYVREHGVVQFINTYNRVKDRKHDVLKWGDEIEYHCVKLDHEKKTAKLSLTATETVAKLVEEDKKAEGEPEKDHGTITWHPEYGEWMVEATPGAPYGDHTADLLRVQANMAERRRRISAALPKDTVVLSMTNFPLTGVGMFTEPALRPGGCHAASAYVPDKITAKHPRFGTLTENIRRRRGEHVRILVPLFKDELTDMDTAEGALPEAVPADCGPVEGGGGGGGGGGADGGADDAAEAEEVCVIDPPMETIPGESEAYPLKPGFIHMDAMAFGMGMCCLQVTFQARDLLESRKLYDQLSVISPIVLALTAATPIFKGRLADVDVRWDTIGDSVDGRTRTERGHPGSAAWQSLPNADQASGKGARRITKSRYASIDTYISERATAFPELNDLDLVYDEATLEVLTKAGIDKSLALHIAHLFIRDPLVIFADRVEMDDAKEVDHWENIQSTNWQNVRWKPPPPDAPKMGWRVELRTMEIQITDFENAAFSVFAALLTRAIVMFDLDLLVPITKVDANMATAHQRDSVLDGRFYFRKHVVPLQEQCAPGEVPEEKVNMDFELMSCEEILLGKGKHYPGLVPLIFAYLDIIKCDSKSRLLIDTYLRFIVDRATGDLPTNAAWIRKFVRSHPAYKKDSVVGDEITYDLLRKVTAIANGETAAPDLLGTYQQVVGGADGAKGTRLRGRSLTELIGSSECFVVKEIMAKYEKHAVKTSFQDTKAFLGGRFAKEPVTPLSE